MRRRTPRLLLEIFEKTKVDFPDDGIYFNEIIHELHDILVMKALNATGHNLAQAARLLGLNRTTLSGKLKKMGYKRELEKEDGF